LIINPEENEMNIVITDGGRTLVDFEITEDSHVYISDGVSEYYRDWEELDSRKQEAFMKVAGLWVETLRDELGKLAK
jgi:uncharacterized protein (UPF0216 family)